MQTRFEVQRQVSFDAPTTREQAYQAIANVQGVLSRSSFIRNVTDRGAGEFDCKTGVGPLSGRWCAHFAFEPGTRVQWTTKVFSGAGIQGGDLTGEIAVQPLDGGRCRIAVSFNAMADASVPRLLVGQVRKAFEKLGDSLVRDFCEGIRAGLEDESEFRAAA
ncbi:MAG: hypothetical protein IT371_22935 [Deltaproteobacteria bacterium]|nr:hypothetical protein [Deltaproteobacteria bacterium]